MFKRLALPLCIALLAVAMTAIPGVSGSTTDLLADAKGHGFNTRLTGSSDGSITSCRSTQHMAQVQSDHLGEYGEEGTGSALWVYSSGDGFVRSGTWGSMTGYPKYMRGASLKSFAPPMAVVIAARVIDYKKVDGRNPQGLKLHLAHDSNDDNYTVDLLTPSRNMGVTEEYPIGSCDSGYTGLGGRSFSWKTGITYIFKVAWTTDGKIRIYCRGESPSDGYANGCPLNSDPNNRSNDKLLHTVTDSSPKDAGGVGWKMDGSRVRFYDFHVWQGP